MSDYTFRGLQKLAHQVATRPTLIRCPRDSVVMRVLSSRAERQGPHGVRQETFVGMPRDGEWRVLEVDVECPACRRRAMHVRPMIERAEPAQASA